MSCVSVGGASALTPSEVQEIRAQADAEFENEGKINRKKQRKADSREDEDRTFIGKIPKSVDLLRFKVLFLRRINIFLVMIIIGLKLQCFSWNFL